MAPYDYHQADDLPEWLYRGVPAESPEVQDVRATGEISPPRPDLRSEWHRQQHLLGFTDTAYTSWSAERSIAEYMARLTIEQEGLRGGVIVFRVRVETIDVARLFPGCDDEQEWLIEGRVEGVELSEFDDESE